MSLPHTPAPAGDAAPRPALLAGAHAPFLALLGTGRHLLEAGCGAGEDLRFFREQGLVVTAFDASREQAAAASRLCGQPVRVCRFEQMRSVVPYDGIWAGGSLPCLPELEIAPVLGHLATLLKAGGPPTAPSPTGMASPCRARGSIRSRPGSTSPGCSVSSPPCPSHCTATGAARTR
ncbi:class I SAM-dependent methyltransferase [Aeromonas caviae]